MDHTRDDGVAISTSVSGVGGICRAAKAPISSARQSISFRFACPDQIVCSSNELAARSFSGLALVERLYGFRLSGRLVLTASVSNGERLSPRHKAMRLAAFRGRTGKSLPRMGTAFV